MPCYLSAVRDGETLVLLVWQKRGVCWAVQLGLGTIHTKYTLASSPLSASSSESSETYFGSGSAVCTTSSIGLEFARSLCCPPPSPPSPAAGALSKLELRTGREAYPSLPVATAGGVLAGLLDPPGERPGLRELSRLGKDTLRAGKGPEDESMLEEGACEESAGEGLLVGGAGK